MGATYVELKGKFTFAINQSGLDYHNKEEREHAVENFWNEFEDFTEHVGGGFIDFIYKKDNLKVEEGE
jgi:hypothetical protein